MQQWLHIICWNFTRSRSLDCSIILQFYLNNLTLLENHRTEAKSKFYFCSLTAYIYTVHIRVWRSGRNLAATVVCTVLTEVLRPCKFFVTRVFKMFALCFYRRLRKLWIYLWIVLSGRYPWTSAKWRPAHKFSEASYSACCIPLAWLNTHNSL